MILPRFQSRRAVPAICFVLLAALGGGGCSNSPYPVGQTSQNVLYKFLNFEPKTFDPTISFSLEEAAVLDLIYPSFYRYHYLKQSPFEQELALGAAEPVVVAGDGKRRDLNGKTVPNGGQLWTFRIRKDLRFQDDACFPGGKGRPISAADFLYSFRRLADASVDCPVLPWVQDKIVGMDAYAKANAVLHEKKQPADFAANVEGLIADPNDAYIFQIKLNQPYPQLRYLMAMHFTTPIAKESVAHYGEEFARRPVGCGAYLLEEYSPKQRIVLVKNPHRFAEFYPTAGESGDRDKGLLADAGKQLPLTDKVVFSYLKEKTTQWNLFQQGYLDSVGVSKDTLRQTLGNEGQPSPEMRARGITIKRAAGLNCYYYAFRMTDSVVGGYTDAKRKLRQAISLAVDSNEYIRLFAVNQARKAEFLIPKGMFGYDKTFVNEYVSGDIERGRKLLAEAGYPDGKDPKTGERLTIYFDINEGGAGMRQYTGQLQKQVERLGVEFKVREWRTPVYRAKLIKGDFSIASYSWWADYPDPENFLFLFTTENKSVNYAGYSNKTYDALFEKMKRMDDTPERREIIEQMRTILLRDCPWVYNYHSEALNLDHQWLKNVKAHGIANDTAKYQKVDAETRARLQAQWNQKNWWPLVGVLAALVASAIPAALTVRQKHERSLRTPRLGENGKV